MDKPSACKRRVLDNAISSLDLKLRDLCRFPCLGWCGKTPMPCCTSKPPPQNTCDDCYWVCTACYVRHFRIYKKPDTSDQTASTSASAVERRRRHKYCYETTSRIMAPAGSATLCTI